MSKNLSKKELANLIKTDLKKELSGRNLTELSDYGLVSGNDNIFSISEYFVCSLRKHIFKPSDFEKEDYDEIVGLIQQRLQLRTKALVAERANKSGKLDSNPNLFYHLSCARYKAAGAYEEKGMRRYHQFWGRKNGQDYHINVAVNHPALNSVIFSDKDDNPKEGNYYLIEGVENLPSEPNIPQHWEVEGRFFKWVELENDITITLYNDNSEPKINSNNKRLFTCKCDINYTNAEIWYYCSEDGKITPTQELSWFCGKCWQSEEKNYRQKSDPKNTVYKIEPQKDNLGDEHYYYFENGQWISLESGTPDPNTTSSEGKVSRLVTLIDSIQPPKGVKGDSWDYFYYVLATENGERFEINSLNPAIGFDAGTKKEHFQRAGNNGIRFWYKISWKATEPDKRRFEKGDFVEIEKWNAGDKPHSKKDLRVIWEKEWENKKNKNLKKMSIRIISEFFREWNIKAIEITSSKDLLVEYNSGSREVIKNDEKGTGIIKNSLEKILNKNKLDQQELEKLLTGSNSQGNSSTNSPKSGYVPYLIGGVIVLIALGAALIIYRLVRKVK